MGFPIVHTNFWDAVIAVPVVMIITQLLKIFFPIQPKYVPAIALTLGLIISIFISHKHNFLAGVFMGFFYGYAAIGNYASLKTTIKSFKNKKKHDAL
ncbi:hypothetical protein ACIQ1H_04295 [Lysinibacillus sp. NPDC097279]|uniref:hypothetical protein n=1 Tax=unclassified Lysinibacillus TaxID=2636778 RepID=UPI00116976A5|nr:hypothetical protein [Lysinibacillus sp. CD3-6]QPQ35418.1 hypothetical protein JNUCC52_00275 [Lysinibacillus sp. JNUCC-52]UED78546.1 hypothetical protein FH508_0013890 [Lysinibacillus sp. CD3-6]